MTDEEYVRARWTAPNVYLYESARSYNLRLGWIKEFKGTTKDKAAVWSTARAFTEQREREIAEVEEEIALIQDDIVAARTYGEKYQVIRRRVLAVEQARLAELKRGMKEGSDDAI